MHALLREPCRTELAGKQLPRTTIGRRVGHRASLDVRRVAMQVSIELFYNAISAVGGFLLIQSGKMSAVRPFCT